MLFAVCTQVMAKTRRIHSKRKPRGQHCLWNEAAMVSAIQAVRDQGMSQRAACKTFNIPRCTLQVRLSGKTDLGAKPGHPTKLSHEEEEKLVDFACNRAALGVGFGRQQFLSYAERFAKKHKKQFKRGTPSMKWWQGMRKRHQRMTLRQPEGTSAVRHQCMHTHKVAKYFSVLKQVLFDHGLQDKPRAVWNVDETGMQLDHRPGKIVAQSGSKYLHSRTSGNKEMITVVGAVNAAGGCLPPHIIVKGKTKRSLLSFQTENAPTGSTWSVSDSGWTKQGIAMLWFKESFIPSIGPYRPQLLILDGHDSHNFLELIDTAVENQIHILELPAHTSNWLQPCDRTVFGPLKTAYRKACEELTTSFPGVLVSRASFCGLLKRAWNEAVTESNIISGFRACGIYPFCPDAIPTEAYLPNSLYTVATLIENEQLLDSRNVQSEPQDVTATASCDATAPAEQQSLDVDVNPAVGELKPTTADAADSYPAGSVTFDPTQFLSREPAVLEVLCAAAPPAVALNLFESTLSQQQLHCFRYCHSHGYSLDQDEAFSSWKKYLSAVESKSSGI